MRWLAVALLALALLAPPLAAKAQQPARVYRVGFLEEAGSTAALRDRIDPYLEVFRQALP